METGTAVILTKLAATKDALFLPADRKEYKTGLIFLGLGPTSTSAIIDIPDPTKSLPVDYELRGSLRADVVVGQPLRLLRTHRDGYEALGLTDTSPIKEITEQPTGVILTTENSIYRLEIDNTVD